MKAARAWLAALLCLASPFLFVSCVLFPPSDDPSQYYVLASLDDSGDSKQLASKSELVVLVGPVTIATYLDRNQIVSRKSTNELEIAEFHVWGEPLDEGISRVVTRNLTQLLDSSTVNAEIDLVEFDYRVGLHINQFEATEKGMVALDCSWRISGAPGSGIKKTSHASRITVPVDSPVVPASGEDQTREATAAAMSEAVNRLSVEIAGELVKLGKPGADGEEEEGNEADAEAAS